MVGPTFGGLLDELFGWRANFIAFAVLGIAGLCLSAWQLAETNRNPSASLLRLDGYRDLARSGRFRAYALCMAFSIGTLYAFIGGAPLVAALLHPDVSSTTLGLYMGIVPAGFLAGSYIVGRLGSRYAPSSFIVAGRALTCLGLLAGFALYFAGPMHLLAFFGPCVCVGLGNGLTMPSANARVLSIRPDLAGTSAGLAATLTVAGASTIAFLSGLVVTPSNAHAALLGMMLASSLLALGFGISAVALENATSRSDRRP
jgi:predicted MFS family arabinose efflux permease